MENLKEKKLTDLSLVSFLLTTGHKFDKTSVEGRSTVFHFQDSSRLEQSIIDFYNGRTSVDARSLFANLKCLKSLIFTGRDNNGR